MTWVASTARFHINDPAEAVLCTYAYNEKYNIYAQAQYDAPHTVVGPCSALGTAGAYILNANFGAPGRILALFSQKLSTILS